MTDFTDNLRAAGTALINAATAFDQTLTTVASSVLDAVPGASSAPTPPSSVPADISALKRPLGMVLEYGDLFTYPAPPPHADYAVGSLVIKNHYWGSRWYAGQFVVKNKIADLVAKKLLPPHSRAQTNVGVYSSGYDSAGLPLSLGYAGPMDYQLPKWMGQTGDNSGIGPFPEQCAAYIATESPALLSSVEAYARNGLTLPFHVRDPKTGKPVDYRTYPDFCTYQGQDNSMVNPAERTGITGNTPAGVGIDWDTAHLPNFFHLAYALTDDPVWLEELQLAVSFCWGHDFPNNAHHLDNLQVRELAWGMRDLVNVITATRRAESLGPLPDFLLPSDYFMQTMMLPTINWLGQFMADTSPASYAKLNSVFGQPGSFVPWQIDFLTIAVATGVWQGVAELQPVFNWLAHGLVERLTGKQGWNPDYPTLYYVMKPTADWKTSWAQAVVEEPRFAIGTPAGAFLPTPLQNDYSDYVGWALAATRMGKLIGHTDLTALYPAFATRVKSSGIPLNFRHSIGE